MSKHPLHPVGWEHIRRMKLATEKQRSYIFLAHGSAKKCAWQISLYMFNKCVTLLLHRPYILCMCMCVCDTYMIYLNILYFLFLLLLLHFLCAELGYLFFWMMQWVNKVVYQEGNLLRYKDLATTICFGLIKQMEFHASGKLWRRTPIAHATSVNKSGRKSLKRKATGWFLATQLLPAILCCFEASCSKSRFCNNKKSDVFTCEMLKLLTTREWSGWLPRTSLSESNSFMNM